jgi:hypothetical protein
MTQAKQQTISAADEYAALKQQRFEDWLATTFTDEALKGVDLFEVKAPSGMKFKCRKVTKEYLGNAGQIPMILSSQVAEAMSGEKPTEADAIEQFTKMTPAERLASMRASAQMVRYCVVEPRLILGTVNGHKNAIHVDDLTMEDFGALSRWASGGDVAEGLKTFRRKRK